MSATCKVVFAHLQISLCRNTEAEQEKVIEAVKQEIDLMAKFNHPNVMRILGATQQGCHFFVFVEWMPGSVQLSLDCCNSLLLCNLVYLLRF